MARDGWHPASREERCPKCNGDHNCTISDDHGAVWCGRIESDRQNAGGQFLHRLVEKHVRGSLGYSALSQRQSAKKIQLKTATKSEDPDEWLVQMLISLEHSEIDTRRRELANQLGVDIEPLRRLQVGWLGSHWVMPERNAAGRIIGINRRFQNGTKRQLPGSSRGLTYADDWLSDDGPILMVEGFSDVAAGMSAGCCVIGRPSNVGGVAMLAELLRGHADRELIVIGENDRKLHSGLSDKNRAKHEPQCEGCSRCWPGLHGAKMTARQLAERLNRSVTVMMPRVEKDVRQILQRSRAGEEVV